MSRVGTLRDGGRDPGEYRPRGHLGVDRVTLPGVPSRSPVAMIDFDDPAGVAANDTRQPASRPACVTQFRMAWADGSNSRAKSSGVRPARTRSTICCLNTAGYGGLVFGICRHPSSQENRCPRNRGNFGSSPLGASRCSWDIPGPAGGPRLGAGNVAGDARRRAARQHPVDRVRLSLVDRQ